MVRTQECVHSTALLSADCDTNVGLGEMFIRLVMNSVFFFQGEEERKYVEVKNRAENQTIFL